MRDFFMLAILTGVRRGNLQAMRWDELDLERGIWRIPLTKSGEPQSVYLHPEAVAILERRREMVGDSEYVFPAAHGKSGHLTSQYKAWKRICERAGLQNLRPHDLRRTLGSWQAATGASLPVIGKSLGHRSQEATAVYARLDLDPVRVSVNRAVEAMLAAGKDGDEEG